MDLNLIYSSKRSELYLPQTGSAARSEFQRDFDRIIFSSAFRRLQNKTQVFPLPGSVFVHNRLTHSLEVASVGRTLGAGIGEYIAQKYQHQLTTESQEFYQYSLYNVISAACLCHDIGNPAFGHSGEDAIAIYFKRNSTTLQNHFSEKEWSDLINFEGNANAIRILTQQQSGKSTGGLLLTYATLASIAKYPCESIAKSKKEIHRKKFGFFQSEKQNFLDIAQSTQMIQLSEEPIIFQRHPFVWLVEAADDICYNIIDLEDAHRLGIISHEKCLELFLNFIRSIASHDVDKINTRVKSISNKNDRIAYLRAKTIHYLILSSIENFINNESQIFSGNQTQSIFDIIKSQHSAIQEIENFTIENIYNHRSVIEIENAGYNVMAELLSHFIAPIILNEEERDNAQKKAVLLIPTQFLYENESIYQRVMGVIDYVSGMTDNYATDLYRKIKGIDIGMTI
jgi:dGTPase